MRHSEHVVTTPQLARPKMPVSMPSRRTLRRSPRLGTCVVTSAHKPAGETPVVGHNQGAGQKKNYKQSGNLVHCSGARRDPRQHTADLIFQRLFPRRHLRRKEVAGAVLDENRLRRDELLQRCHDGGLVGAELLLHGPNFDTAPPEAH